MTARAKWTTESTLDVVWLYHRGDSPFLDSVVQPAGGLDDDPPGDLPPRLGYADQIVDLRQLRPPRKWRRTLVVSACSWERISRPALS